MMRTRQCPGRRVIYSAVDADLVAEHIHRRRRGRLCLSRLRGPPVHTIALTGAVAGLGLLALWSLTIAHATNTSSGKLQKVVFYGCAAGSQGPGIHIARDDFSDPIRLTTPPPNVILSEAHPSMASGCDVAEVSPDGRKLALSRNGYLHLVDLATLVASPGTQPRPVMGKRGDIVYGWAPAWSPDGLHLALHTGKAGLYVVKPDGGGFRLLLPWPGGNEEIRQHQWAPQGNAIALCMGSLGSSHLYLLTDLDQSDGPRVQQLTDHTDYMECWPIWSPDGSRLLFTRGPKGERLGGPTADIWVLEVRARRETRLTNTQDYQERGVGWHDGKVYFVREPSTSGGVPCICRAAPDGTGVEELACEVLPAGRVQWVEAGPIGRGVSASLVPREDTETATMTGAPRRPRPPVGTPGWSSSRRRLLVAGALSIALLVLAAAAVVRRWRRALE